MINQALFMDRVKKYPLNLCRGRKHGQVLIGIRISTIFWCADT
jgi:hypothetical protein